MPPVPTHACRPLVVLSANTCWNLAHFRSALLTGLASAGYRIAVLAAPDQDVNRLRALGIEVRRMPMARSGTNPVTDAMLLLRYVRELRALQPLAYCGFTIKPNIYGAIAARMAGVPAINNVTGIGTALLSQGMVWAIAERLYRLAFRRSQTVFFHNRADLDFMVGKGIVTSAQAHVIPGSGVDLEHFRPEVWKKSGPGGTRRFLFIGRLILHKGVREFVAAARILKQKLPETRFLLLGNRDPGNPTSIGQAELQTWINEGVVEHLGERADVRPAIGAATAVVLPSYREGMSRALLEGAAMGKPLVGTDVPGSRELIEDGVTGALCAPRDAVSLAAAMERIAVAPSAEIARLGANARALVEREFGEQVVVRAYLDVLERIKAARS